MERNKVLEHCKKHLSELREKKDDIKYPLHIRTKYNGAFMAYKDIYDGIVSGYFNHFPNEKLT